MNDITDLSENERPARNASVQPVTVDVQNRRVDDFEAWDWCVRVTEEAYFEKQCGNG